MIRVARDPLTGLLSACVRSHAAPKELGIMMLKLEAKIAAHLKAARPWLQDAGRGRLRTHS